jgi:N6-L-threonylcarbamoyladenine synthase
MKILAIETSCDETAIALMSVRGNLRSEKNFKIKIIKSVVSSQVKLHAKYGGVVPNLAKREHIRNLPILLDRVASNPKVIDLIDLISVTVGPGLEPALWTGIQFAEELSKKWGKPLIGANHLDGHLYSFLLAKRKSAVKDGLFPMVSLIVSGGHTILAVMKNLKSYKKLGETLDDAVGESFDKVARLLNLSYPGGPALEKLARKGNPNSIPFPSPMVNQKNYDFSYSGLKTAVLYYLKNLGSSASDFSLTAKEKKQLKDIESQGNIQADIAASFQRAAFEALAKKSIRAAKEFAARSITIGGGVAANKILPKMIKKEASAKGLDVKVIVPPLKYCMDNAVMIGLGAYITRMKGKKYVLKADGNLNV